MNRQDSDTDLFFDTHIFCCLNERKPGHSRGSCGGKTTEKLRGYLKKKIKKHALKDKMRVNQSGCLDRCELGPVMVIYPEGTWYHYSSTEDIDEIFETHIVKGETVKRLLLKNDQ